ncbi:MAG TPA: ankyrin repeat domain-containing protein [Asticcacaulis sp.]|nr:ankyrin repeat domain-containing protein [Asticcacaulis sp.]
MRHHYFVPLLGLLAMAAFPAMAAARPCVEADLAGAYAPNGYSYVSVPEGTPPADLAEDVKRNTLVGFFDMPVIKYPYGSLKTYGVSIRLIVGVDGRVRCASLAPFRGGDEPEMNDQRKAFLDKVSGWRFLPYQLDGEVTPVAAEIPVFEEELPGKHVDMPAGDPAQMTVAYDVHGGMYGPSYHVELHGDGTAFFMSTAKDDPLGPQVYQVDPKAVQALLADARAVDFWSLRDLYREAPDVFPSNFTRIGITVGGISKSVTGHEASDAGEPGDLRELGPKIEKAADIKVWQQPTLATLDRLKAGGFDFTSDRAGWLLINWAGDRDIADEVPLALMQLGAPLLIRAFDREQDPDLLETALGAGRVEMGRRLIAAGLLLDKDGKPDPDKVNRDFIAAIDSGEVGAVDLIAPFHPDLTCADRWQPSKRVSVLFRLREMMIYPPPDRVPIAQRLLAMGADINARDATGTSVLMYETDLPFLTFLLDHGADINATTDEGWTALAAAFNQDVALLLLARGADPRRGKTPQGLREKIRQEHWRKVPAWLRAHGYADVLVAQPGDDQ